MAEAMKLIWDQRPEVFLVLAGPDMVVDGASNYIRFLKIIGTNNKLCLYASNLQPEVLVPVVNNSFFTVLPSIEDNCPNSMLEAMSLGKVVLGTYGSGMDEFYPELCKHLLVPKRDVHALAEKILWLWDLPREELELFGLSSKIFVNKNHNQKKCAEELRNYYHFVLA